MKLAGKKAAVIGLGVSNSSLIHFLIGQGAVVTVCDKKEAGDLKNFIAPLEGLPLCFKLGEGYLDGLEDFDVIFLTPGMRRDFPQLVKAREKGVVFSSEMKEFLCRCPGKVIGITGSSGKTTSTTLVGKIMQQTGKKVFVGGNIGNPLINRLSEMDEETWIVLELSSFQLQDIDRSPMIAAITNITPNHLDMHSCMEEYVEAKKNIFRFQKGPESVLVLNEDYEITKNMDREASGRVYFFSGRRSLREGACLEGDELILKTDGRIEKICKRQELKLLGLHNVENVLLASLLARLAGASLEDIKNTVTAFTGVEHRLELVRVFNEVAYYNDSISTTPARATAGILAMERPIVLIAGGYDKKLPFDEFARVVVEKCRAVVLLGETAPLLERSLEEAMAEQAKKITLYRAETFSEAIYKAKEAARAGDAVLLSPACASYDMFRDFKERGDLFKKIVQDFS